MGDRDIPPPRFNIDGLNQPLGDFEEDIIDTSFQNLIDSSDQDEAKRQQEALNQLKQREDDLQKAIQKEEINETKEIEGAEEEVEVEEEKEVLDDEKAIDEEDHEKESKTKDAKHSKKSQTSLKPLKRQVKERNKSEVQEEETLNEHQKTSKKSDLKSNLDQDPVEELEKEAKSDLKSQKIKEQIKQDSLEQKASKSHKEPKVDKTKSSKATQKETIVALNISLQNPIETTYSHNTKEIEEDKLELYDAYEALAEKLVEEAKVLENGDVIETKVQLNLEGSELDKGEISIKTHKYRPLEVNLKFTNFTPSMSNKMKKSKEELLKTLKRHSLKVHQLDILD